MPNFIKKDYEQLLRLTEHMTLLKVQEKRVIREGYIVCRTECMHKEYPQAYYHQQRSWHPYYKKIRVVVFWKQSANICPDSAKKIQL